MNIYRTGWCLLLLLLLVGCRSQGGEHRQASWAFSPDSVLQEGDLVFRRGTGMASHLVLAADKGGVYSHIGIVVREDEEWKIIHFVPGEPDFPGDYDRVKMDDFRSFFKGERAKAGAVMRAELTPATIHRTTGKALEIYRSGMPFDHSYDLSDTSKMYCTEFIRNLFANEGIDLTGGKLSRIGLPGFRGDYILPTDIQHSPLLTLIYQF